MSMHLSVLFGLASLLVIMYLFWQWGVGKRKEHWTGIVEEKNRIFIPRRKVWEPDEWDVTLYIRTTDDKLVTVNFTESDVSNAVKQLDVGDQVKKEEGEEYPYRT